MWKNIFPSSQQTPRAAQQIRSNLMHTSRREPISTTQRPFSTITCLQKQNQNSDNPNVKERETLKPERSEVTKSGTDNEVAHHPAAYDPNQTSPERELESTAQEHHREGKEGNPLNMSPANPDVSAWRGPTEGGPDRGAERGASSAKGGARKNRKVQIKEDGTHVSYK